jgi:hypothetical protein
VRESGKISVLERGKINLTGGPKTALVMQAAVKKAKFHCLSMDGLSVWASASPKLIFSSFNEVGLGQNFCLFLKSKIQFCYTNNANISRIRFINHHYFCLFLC